jgi:hypothetical protein
VTKAWKPFRSVEHFARASRANAYLQFRAKVVAKRQLVRADAQTDINGGNSPHEITRRELLDLGTTNGETVTNLVVALLAEGPDGLTSFKKLGTSRSVGSEDVWRRADPKELAKLLRPWSAKQIRDHFHALVAEGLITGHRVAANQPWRYILPEVMCDRESPFAFLPKPDTLVPKIDVPSMCPDIGADGSCCSADTYFTKPTG